MNKKAVAFALGRLFQVNAWILIVPLMLAIWDSLTNYSNLTNTITKCGVFHIKGFMLVTDIWGFIAAILVSAILGSILVHYSEKSKELQQVKDGFAIVTFGWILMAALGAIPFALYFYVTQGAPGFGQPFLAITNAYFETMSGFTTTGSTILTDIEALPRSLLFWRSTTHWLGGMGIITLALAIFPALGISGYNMFKGEVPGPTAERLQPRLAETAKILWGVYGLLTVAETLLLMAGGMPFFDSICHSFGTLATGGFSTQNASIAAYQSSYIQWVIIAFMYLAGVNFLIHYQVLRGHFDDLKQNSEFIFYTGIVVLAICISTFLLFNYGLSDYDSARDRWRNSPVTERNFMRHYHKEQDKVASLEGALRTSAFQVLSVTTTTGFATADFDLWPNFLRMMLVLMMFFGGCAGSTGGGIKMIRIMVVLKTMLRELKIVIQPRLITSLKISGQPMQEKNIINIMSFFITFVFLFGFFSLVMNFFIPDLPTAITSVVATLCNIGPGLCGVGSIENFDWIPITGKWILTLCMLIGRLEVFTVLIFLIPSTWKK